MAEYDAAVVGAGPNGLGAAIELARNGKRVLVVEGRDQVGGGARTSELTLPGYRHDVCSAVFALGHASPFFKSLRLGRYGLEWIQPELPAAQAHEAGAIPLRRDLGAMAAELGEDGDKYKSIMAPLVNNPAKLYATVLGPLVRRPPHPILMARFGLVGLPSARQLAGRFKTERARALLSGFAGHATSSLRRPLTGAMALVLAAAAHTDGYPFAKGGAQSVSDALAAALIDLGGEIETDTWVRSLNDLPAARVYLLDLMPGAAADLAGKRVPALRRFKMRRWKHGPATFKVDYATSAPIPWADPVLRRAGTVHIGGSFEEVEEAEQAPWQGRHAERPFVILTQASVFDGARTPDDGHTVWAYAHVPNGSTVDITDRITAQIERFAPGFTSTILQQHVTTPSEMEAYNPSNVGGDIAAGRFGLWRIAARPRFSTNPYRIGNDVYLCSAATPPGVGVHGMSGYHAARSALRALG